MPMTLAQFGQTVKAKHPEYADMDDAAVGQKTLAKYPEYADMVSSSASSSTPPPAAAPGWRDSLTSRINRLFPEVRPGDDDGGFSFFGPSADAFIANAGDRTIRSLSSAVLHPWDTTKAAVHSALDLAQPPAAHNGMDIPLVGRIGEGGPLDKQVHQYADTAHTQGKMAAASDITGDALTSYLMGKGIGVAGDAVAGPAATAANFVGRSLKRGGALVDRMTVGAPKPVDNLGADVGGALSENRIVATTPRNLQAKISTRVGPAAQARDSILDRSTAGPSDIAPDVDKPFRDIAASKTDNVTGAVRPGQVKGLTTARRAIQEVQDPETGNPTGEPKPTELFPAEMGQLQRNIYDMTDYSNPESDLANQGLKGAAANLRTRINQVAPEASTMTDTLHDMLGAQDHLKMREGAPASFTDLGPGKVGGKLLDRVRYGAGTATGAMMDLTGSGLMNMGGLVRRIRSGSMGQSPVAPRPPIDSRLPTPAALPASIATDASEGTPIDLDPDKFPGTGNPPITPPAPSPTLALPSSTSEGIVRPPLASRVSHPDEPYAPAARNRTVPTQFAPRPASAPARRLLVTPEGIRPEPIPLQPPPAAESLNSSRTPLVNRVTGRTKPTLASQVESVPTGLRIPSRLPDSTDIDGWEALVDEGMAKYNTRTHSYDYTGPIRKGSR